MKTKRFQRLRRGGLLLALALLLLCLPLFGIFVNGGGMSATNTIAANADSGDAYAVNKYEVEMNLLPNRKVEVKEKISVKILVHGASMFYRSLPTTGARYENITASCPGNTNFSYHVADNPDVDGFIDVNCVGNVVYWKEWTYEISYVMQQATDEMADDIILDVVGYGWTVPLHDVSVTVHFPQKPQGYTIHTDVYGQATNTVIDKEEWLNDTTLYFHTPLLGRMYSWEYDVYVAGLTLETNFAPNVLTPYWETRVFTEDIWKIVLASVVAIGLCAVLLIVTKTKREVVTVVNIKAPDDMDPMQMGKWIDGAVNNEDITSMIYYFANKGYLRIDFSNQDDPELIACVSKLPETASIHEKTVFNGLFKEGRVFASERKDVDDEPEIFKAVRVSEMVGSFYETSQIAAKQVPSPPTMYEKKSKIGYFAGGVIGVLLGALVSFLMSGRIGGDYRTWIGMGFLLPVAGIVALGYISENYRYKWKKWARIGIVAAQIAIAVISTLIICSLFLNYILTEYEKLVLCIGVFGSTFITQTALSRTEAYLDALGEILGFKEFIVVTEEDKIKVMLEENPELYYKVLPYARVLGVTNEWEDKFENILLQPPTWYAGTDITVFDYIIIRRCMSRSITASMANLASSKAGTFIGKGGGGGSFGGFGGGGFGGGGGGVR